MNKEQNTDHKAIPTALTRNGMLILVAKSQIWARIAKAKVGGELEIGVKTRIPRE